MAGRASTVVSLPLRSTVIGSASAARVRAAASATAADSGPMTSRRQVELVTAAWSDSVPGSSGDGHLGRHAHAGATG